MAGFTRRLLLGTGAAALAGGSALAQGASGPLRVRRSIATMTPNDPDLAAYIRGMRAMRKRADLMSWGQQVFIHGHDWGQHGGWRFLPWHRTQLYWFEQMIARFSDKPDFAMPYWDWQSTPVLPAFVTDRTGPLYHRRRRGDLATVNFVRARAESNFHNWANLFQDDFDTFVGRLQTAGSVESSGHGFVHVTIDGDMGDTSTAPRDPIFWMHHCNIDRVWATWQPRAEARGVPMKSGWLDERFDNFLDPWGQMAPSKSTRDVIRTEPLGYRYDAPYPSVWFDEQPPKPPEGKTRREVVAVHDFTIALTDQPGAKDTLRIPLPPDIAAILASDRTGATYTLTGRGEVRMAGEKLTGTAVRIAVRRLGGTDPVLTTLATVIPFVGVHPAPAAPPPGASAAMPGMTMSAPAIHEHGFAFAIGPQLFDATGFDGVQEVEVQASVAWLPANPPPAADDGYAPPAPPPLPEAPLITCLSLALSLTEYRWV
jgi:hypothetical protein